jgi:HlyD family secretion protein
MRMSVVTALGVLAIIGTGFASYGNKSRQAYITAPVERGSVSTVVKATGIVNPVLMVDVGSQLSGQISGVFVNFNDPVKAGQVIARVDPQSYIAMVTEAKAALSIAAAAAQQQGAALQRAKVAVETARTAEHVAEADLAAIEVKQDEAERDYQRNLGLSKTSAISDRDFTQSRAIRNAGLANIRSLQAQLKMKSEAIQIAEADLAIAEANFASAEAVVEQKRASLEQAEVNLQWTEIRAPIDGVVIKRIVNPGQTVAVSLESKTLFKIANDLRVMEVHGRIDEADIGQVKVGQIATFTVDAYPNKAFSGRVLQVRKSPEVSQSVVTYIAVISASNPDYLLFPGMTARLSVAIEETGDALRIPNTALRFRPPAEASSIKPPQGLAPGSAIVWVAREPDRATPVSVVVGKNDDSDTQLISGDLHEGEAVIVGTVAPNERHGLFGLW